MDRKREACWRRRGWVLQGSYHPATELDSFTFEGGDISEKRYRKFLRELRNLDRGLTLTGLRTLSEFTRERKAEGMRIKPKKGITTKEGAEAALARLDGIDRMLAGWYMSEAEAVAAARAAHTAKQVGRAGFEAEKVLLVKELEDWAEEASANWGTRTFETSSGKLGFRMAPPSVSLIKRVAKKFENAVELLMLTLPEFVRKVYEVDKESILAADRVGTLSRDALSRCGLEVKQEDEFWVETSASKDFDEAAKKLKRA